MKVCLDKINASGYSFEIKFNFTEDKTAFAINKFSGSIYKKDDVYELKAEMELDITEPCDRCLEVFTEKITSTVNINIEQASCSNDLEEEKELTEEDMNVYFMDDNILELEDIAKQEAMVLRDYKRICHIGCKGICPVCGQNLNEQECNCNASIDIRWKALNEYVNKNQE